mmetsp:Transcript_34692/g.80992  ORF Transcript_34692/g.80992 Transcript_34692/m.80992 type:complete len:203 (-) Transcript_34692:178-786(-)
MKHHHHQAPASTDGFVASVPIQKPHIVFAKNAWRSKRTVPMSEEARNSLASSTVATSTKLDYASKSNASMFVLPGIHSHAAGMQPNQKDPLSGAWFKDGRSGRQYHPSGSDLTMRFTEGWTRDHNKDRMTMWAAPCGRGNGMWHHRKLGKGESFSTVVRSTGDLTVPTRAVDAAYFGTSQEGRRGRGGSRSSSPKSTRWPAP